MYIKAESIEELKRIASIEKVLEYFGITLNGNGKHKGIIECPCCHKDSSHVKVNIAKNFASCFVCDFHATPLTYITKYQGYNFKYAVIKLAEIMNFELEYDGTMKTKNTIMLDAALYYRKQYQIEFKGKTYRGITEKTATKYGLGYAIGFKKLYNHLREKGYTEEEILETGLVIKKVEDDKVILRDKFFKSVIFPDIRNGKVVDFATRCVDPKYKTSHMLLYGKHNRIGGHLNNNDTRILCEAPLDAASLNQITGLPSISICGSKTKVDKYLVTQYQKKKVILAFDMDEAGREAIIKYIEIAMELKVNLENIQVMVYHEGCDPNDILTKNLLFKLVPSEEFLLKILLKNFKKTTIEKVLSTL